MDADDGLDLGELDTTEYVYISTTCLMLITTLLLNIAMGCVLEPRDFRRQWNTLGGTLAGALLQYLVFPASAFLINHLMNLPGHYSIAMTLTAACPASALTALVTFYINGDVCLSFCLTAVNSAVSIGFAPAMLHLYSRSWTHQTLHIALWPLISGLVLHIVSPIIGYFIKRNSAYVAWFVEKICTVIGLLSFVSDCILQVVAFERYMQHTTIGMVFAILLLPSLGWISAYLLAWLFHQNIWKRRSICVEILLHNVSLAMLILGTTFHDFEAKLDVAAVLALFNPISGLYGLIVVVAYNLRAPWSKSGSGRLLRAGEVQDLHPTMNAGEDSEEEINTTPNKKEVNLTRAGTTEKPPAAMVWGPITVSTSHGQDNPMKQNSTVSVKAPDPPLALVQGPIQVSVI
ncbi:solute carrier family 10 member 6-like [Acanthaster planci]|uniref:Solute carrier family 10 member 6-like n=1 Tax=Acanthaster planci TaxID=133434 RepID=A0A8B7ZQX1_ACAPL|nr:solute carrier family 10 member 6-like [Acanthaster planci]